MKHIVYVINSVKNNGPVNVLKAMISSLDTSKYKITILTLIDENNNKDVKYFKEKGIDVYELNLKKKKSILLKERKTVHKAIRILQPDIIHVHGIVPTYFVKNLKTRAIKLVTIHNTIREDYQYTYGKVIGLIIAKFNIIMLKKFNHVICCSETSYKSIKSEVSNISFVRNGIVTKDLPNNKNKIRELLDVPKDATVYVYVGKLSKLKRILQLLEEFRSSHCDNEYLLVLGDGELKRECEKFESSNIRILGFKHQPLDYMLASDVYVSASSSEGFSLSIIEALQCGLHLLLSDIPSHRECFNIDDEYYIGELFEISNFASAKEKLITKMNKNNKENLKEFQEKYLSSSSMMKGYEKFYE